WQGWRPRWPDLKRRLTDPRLVVILLTMDITATQQAILALIAERIEAEGMPPSQAEIARAFGFKGVRAAQYHLEALEAAGAIERIPGRARGIRVLQAPAAPQQQLQLDDALQLPVLGQVAAGAPIGADGGVAGHVVVPGRGPVSPAAARLAKGQGGPMRARGHVGGALS